MSCENKIMKNITSDCSTATLGGIETTVYLVNRTDIDTITFSSTSSNIITDFTLLSGAKAYKLKGIKKMLSIGFDRVVAEDSVDKYIHKLDFKGFEFDSESTINMDNMSDLVAIAERKDKQSTDSTFVMLGLGTGLYVTSDAMMINDNNGNRVISLATISGWEEKYSTYSLFKTSFSVTKELLEALV